ncbi:hypothetical protein DL765_009987 [Monosporascus sp. GIB2]|nr:hypothetical protein DL765_009987 [Monosporascus sp. GIB2]
MLHGWPLPNGGQPVASGLIAPRSELRNPIASVPTAVWSPLTVLTITGASTSLEGIDLMTIKNGASSPPLREESEYSEANHPTLDGSGSVFGGLDDGTRDRLDASAKLENSFHGLTPEELGRRGEKFCARHGIKVDDDVRAFRLGATIAGDMDSYDAVAGLTACKREALNHGPTYKWRSPIHPVRRHHHLLPLRRCSEYGRDRRQRHPVLTTGGSSTSATRTPPGECLVAHVHRAILSWVRYRSQVRYDPDVCRRVLAAEAPRCSGHAMADVDRAFGIMLGYVADLASYHVPDGRVIELNWRLMMGSAMIPAVVVCAIVYSTPESPRWYSTKNRHLDAYKAISRLRYEKVQAARDLLYKDMLLQVARNAMDIGRSKPKEISKVRRNRNVAPRPPKSTSSRDNIEYARERLSRERESDPAARVQLCLARDAICGCSLLCVRHVSSPLPVLSVRNYALMG